MKPVWTTPILINKEHCMDTSKIVYKYEDDKIVKKIENPDNLTFGIFDVNEPKCKKVTKKKNFFFF